MLTYEQGKQMLEDNGYGDVILWNDPPLGFNPDHKHPQDVGIVVLDGEITVNINFNGNTYHAGDFYELSADVIHNSEMGPTGCKYVAGKKLSV